jgi:hypothetical protein
MRTLHSFIKILYRRISCVSSSNFCIYYLFELAGIMNLPPGEKKVDFVGETTDDPLEIP